MQEEAGGQSGVRVADVQPGVPGRVQRILLLVNHGRPRTIRGHTLPQRLDVGTVYDMLTCGHWARRGGDDDRVARQ